MSRSYKEQDFEDHIEAHLLGSGYIKKNTVDYDKELCLIPEEVVQFIQDTQPKEYEKLESQYGGSTPEKLCRRLADEISRYGTLHVLRKGIKDRGAKFKLMIRRPSSGLNPEHLILYRKNRFSMVRQVKYSKKNENSLDLVLFLNGIPLVTAELKNSLTGQFVQNAVKQYKKDRDPKEPLFKFKRCLVHFAIGNEEAFMTTRLSGHKTRFFPFNLDTENPPNPNGHKTAYLWEDVLQPDSLLTLLQNYLHVQINAEKVYDAKSRQVVTKESEALIFPRFHQLDVVRKLLKAAKKEGAGHSYLIQHSAGSGKSNSIAWLAHQLASLYQNDGDKDRLFDSIIVITDRRVLDRQLQNTIKQFEQVEGVVKKIDQHSSQLKNALETGKDIIVTTLQKFPVVAQTATNLKGRRFAIIIDEAHSSQSGEGAKKVKEVLNLEEAEQAEPDLFDVEDELVSEIRTRGVQSHISYFAFTATPKNKTLELFGRRDENGHFRAFHIYSMRQAIEEGFIQDVLRNYTTFKRFFKLVKSVESDEEYEKKKAVRLLTSYVDLQPHAIETKTRIMLDHFCDTAMNQIEGRARGMLVTRSRLHAVKYYLMFRKIMKERGLKFKPLIGFSGTVTDPDTGIAYTENSLNQLPPKVSIPEALKLPENRLLIVANKFQTGFDEPLLHTMYVDKKLAGVQAVQTLSRLNRTTRGKTDTVVLDFVNEVEEIQKAFQDYYQVSFLEEETDPNKLYTLQTELAQFEIYTQDDVEEFAEAFFDPAVPGEMLQPILDRAVGLWNYRTNDEREEFRSKLRSYVRLYGFVSQLITFEDADLERFYVYAQHLAKKLPRREGTLPFEVREAVDLDSFRIQQTYRGQIYLDKTDAGLAGITDNTRGSTEEERDFLSNIVQTLNDTYGTELTDEDKVDLDRIREKLEEHEGLQAAMAADNTVSNVEIKFNEVVDSLLLEFVNTKLGLYKKLTKPEVNKMMKKRWFEGFYNSKSH